MSSSISSQWMPTPRPMRRQLARWAGDARSRRGNHSRGAATRRASASVTISSLSVNETSTASATSLLAKVLIPSVDKRFTMLLNQIMNHTEFGTTKTARLNEGNGSKPELCVTFSLLDVDVVRFGALTTEEEKAVSKNAKDFWDRGFFSFAWAKPKGSRRCR